MMGKSSTDRELSRYVRMSTLPLAIRMVEREADFGARPKRPKREGIL